MRSRTSSLDAAAAIQPGRSGTCAPYPLSPFSTMTRYCMISTILQAGLFQRAAQRPGRHLCARLSGDRHRARLGRMTVLPVTATRTCQDPTVAIQQLQQLTNLHPEDYSQEAGSRITSLPITGLPRRQSRGSIHCRSWKRPRHLRSVLGSAGPVDWPVSCILVSQASETVTI